MQSLHEVCATKLLFKLEKQNEPRRIHCNEGYTVITVTGSLPVTKSSSVFQNQLFRFQTLGSLQFKLQFMEKQLVSFETVNDS